MQSKGIITFTNVLQGQDTVIMYVVPLSENQKYHYSSSILMSWRKCNVNAKHHEIANILQCTFVIGLILICIRMMEVPYIAVTDLLASGLPQK